MTQQHDDLFASGFGFFSQVNDKSHLIVQQMGIEHCSVGCHHHIDATTIRQYFKRLFRIQDISPFAQPFGARFGIRRVLYAPRAKKVTKQKNDWLREPNQHTHTHIQH